MRTSVMCKGMCRRAEAFECPRANEFVQMAASKRLRKHGCLGLPACKQMRVDVCCVRVYACECVRVSVRVRVCAW
eukprot:3899428-Pleurochrysis_carterae.AAC.1